MSRKLLLIPLFAAFLALALFWSQSLDSSPADAGPATDATAAAAAATAAAAVATAATPVATISAGVVALAAAETDLAAAATALTAASTALTASGLTTEATTAVTAASTALTAAAAAGGTGSGGAGDPTPTTAEQDTALVVAATTLVVAATALTVAATALTPTCNGIPATIVGTEGDDKIKGTPGDDAIVGLGGNDRIDGKGGNDCIDGGDGNDRIDGGAGNDVIVGSDGDDRIKGGPGDDDINGHDGDDRIDGGDGDDDIDGGPGLDRLDGAAGVDTCVPRIGLVKNCEVTLRTILVDASRDGGVWWFPQVSPFDPAAPHQGKALADYLRSLGHMVTELPRGANITSGQLAGYDLVIRANETFPYTAAELAAYEKIVRSGGSLLLLADFKRPGEVDSLGAVFGLELIGTTVGSTTVDRFVRSRITNGTGPVGFFVGSGVVGHPDSATLVAWLSTDGFLDLDGDFVQDPDEPSGPAVMGLMPFGRGKIVFAGDTNMLEAVPQPLTSDIIRWLIKAP